MDIVIKRYIVITAYDNAEVMQINFSFRDDRALEFFCNKAKNSKEPSILWDGQKKQVLSQSNHDAIILDKLKVMAETTKIGEIWCNTHREEGCVIA